MNPLYSLFNIFRCIKPGDLSKEGSKGCALLLPCSKLSNLLNFKHTLGRTDKKPLTVEDGLLWDLWHVNDSDLSFFHGRTTTCSGWCWDTRGRSRSLRWWRRRKGWSSTRTMRKPWPWRERSRDSPASPVHCMGRYNTWMGTTHG